MTQPASLSPQHAPVLLTGRAEAVAVLLPLLRRHHSFLVTSHARPDGDAIGSVLGMAHLLESMGKQVTAVMADPIPLTFATLPGSDRIQTSLPPGSVDVAIVLECDSVARTGFNTLAAELLINIDHHRSGTSFAHVNWIDPAAPAVGAMLYELAVAAGLPISPAIATCLYAALLTDTVHFTSAATNAQTFAVAQHLAELGADAPRIAEAIYNSFRPARLWVLGAALRRFRIDGAVASSAITDREITEVGAETEDCEGVVNYVVGVEGVRAGVFLRELPDGRFRASLRSKGPVDVATIAEKLGGGGHHNASGCTVDGPMEEALDRITVLLQGACSAQETQTI